ncbi:hypothetical protein SAMN05216573_105134 [Bradyrhizobium sp. Rc3b]|uniref:hypothetical protein n=1 Tax=unclassified Bradyrhizobium TaxID=2631580 RepID=UPI0008E600D3|nr:MULTISPECIES: hypothetical protein [unclassified Bradyrhizobium]MBB4376657.1 hypothetical protein [Bradyrhizobium sp. SBR1B]SFM87092.1 hypothetical protein SAMN05216573_105134 [Bradyrhizobium sp. Rc3b]
MNIDDSEVQARIAEIRERNENMNTLTLSILRNHLEAEQIMNSYVSANGVSKRRLRRMKFSDKMEKCKVFAKGEQNEPWWGVLNAANSLRNTIAHNLDLDEIDRRMADLKEKYLATMTPENAAAMEDQSDDYIAMMACSTCGGFIATLESRVKGAQGDASSPIA